MSWRDVVTGIEADEQEENSRLQRSLHRSLAIETGWKPLRDAVISSLKGEIKELNDDLHAKKILEYGNDLSVVDVKDENIYLIQNPAFPRVQLTVRCHPQDRIVVSGIQCFSGLSPDVKFTEMQFVFATDHNFKACFGDNTHPIQVADKVTEAIAIFFRKARQLA